MVQITERRKSPRVTVNVLAGQTVAGKYFVPLLSDISTKGVRLENPAGLERPSYYYSVLELMLPGCPEIIWARCRPVRNKNNGFFTSQALSFVDISAHHRRLLQEYTRRCLGH